VPLIIRQITQSDLDTIYQDLERYGWLDLIEFSRSFWVHSNVTQNMTIAVDASSAAYLWLAPMTRNDVRFNYYLGNNGQVAIVEELYGGYYKFKRASESNRDFMERAKLQIREAISIGGIFLCEDGPQGEHERVLDAQFLEPD
jgi:hypothetical protein